MTSIIHLSDIHFGRADPRAIEAFERWCRQSPADLVVVSGDLTQRARRWQFEAAMAFLKRIDHPWLIVPGNHDIPLDSPLERFFSPTARFRRYASSNLTPTWQNDHVSIVGLCTARPIALRPRLFTEGAVSKHQLDRVARQFEQNDRPIRIVVQHHPPVLSPGEYHTMVARHIGWRSTIRAYASMRVDLILYGHLHLHQIEHSESHLLEAGRRMLCVMAGSALSTRLHSEPNGFNRISIDGERCAVESISLEEGGFLCKAIRRYQRDAGGWVSITEDDSADSMCENRHRV